MQDERSQLLVRLLTQHHQSLYRYVYALTGNSEDANDILQETSVALFQKIDQFDQSRPFLPWAYRFAYIQVLRWRENSSKKVMVLDDDVVELLARDREHEDVVLHERLRVLPECIQRLPKEDQHAIQSRYFLGVNADSIAESLAWSRRNLFRELERIRRVLMECIDLKLAADEVQ